MFPYDIVRPFLPYAKTVSVLYITILYEYTISDMDTSNQFSYAGFTKLLFKRNIKKGYRSII